MSDGSEVVWQVEEEQHIGNGTALLVACDSAGSLFQPDSEHIA